MKNIRKILAPVLTLLTILLIPTPESVSYDAWKVFALFAATIVALIAKSSSSMGVIGIFSLTTGILLGALTTKEAISGFGTLIAWQIAFVFFIARGFVKTGLSKRMALYILKACDKTTLSLGYGFMFSNLILGPLVPSSAARVGGILLPIIKSVSQILNSTPEEGTQDKAGSFFILLCLYSNAIVSATFLTAAAGNLMIQSILFSHDVNLTWLTWFKYSCIPALVCALLMPVVLYFVYPPKLTNIQKVDGLIHEELEKLGPISTKEKEMSVILFSTLLFWIFGEFIKVDTVLASLMGVCALIAFNVISFEHDILAEKEAWHTLLWLSSLLIISQKLEQSGFSTIVIEHLKYATLGYSWQSGIVILTIIYGYAHYVFASNVSHISAMLSVFFGVLISLGTPPMLAALTLAFSSSLFGGLHYYSSTEAVVLYNSKYVSTNDFFKIGVIMTSFMFFTWMMVGAVWWKILGVF